MPSDISLWTAALVVVVAFGWAFWLHADGFLTLFGLVARCVMAAGISLGAIILAFFVHAVWHV